MTRDARYRFFLISPFYVGVGSPHWSTPSPELPKEERLLNYTNLGHKALLDDVKWELDPGPKAPYGDWAVENREEFELVAAGVLPIVRRACQSREWDAIILLGGGEPGIFAAREIGKRYSVPVVSVGAAQMHVACMLGSKFSVIDLADSHSMHYYNQVIQHHMAARCASIRVIDYPLPRPPYETERSLVTEKEKALSGEQSEGVEEATQAAIAAIQEDGAEVIMFACSLTFWLKPFVKEGLAKLGWDVPVLEGFSCAVTQAKTMVDLGVDASSLAFPSDRPLKLRQRKTF